ncbi:MAG: class I SAM-dependent methyltransferase [Candidatus Acidiferrales bacterium]
MAILTQAEIARKLRGEDLDKWLELWRAEQGPAKRGSLELMAAAIPFSTDDNLRVLDICCGPGDAGRAIFSRFPNACVDFADRDLFFTALCFAVNQRDGVPGRTFVRDLLDPNWHRDLTNSYNVVVAANGLHWFRLKRAAELFADVYELLRPNGSFLFMEPAGPETPFAAGFAMWKHTQPSQHKSDDWTKFWSSVNHLLGYDHIKELGERDDSRIDDKLSVLGWVGLLRAAGFGSIDILLRDAEKVVVAALKL